MAALVPPYVDACLRCRCVAINYANALYYIDRSLFSCNSSLYPIIIHSPASPHRNPQSHRPPAELTSINNVTSRPGGAASTSPKVHINAPQLQETILTGLIPTAPLQTLDCQMKSSDSHSDWQLWMRTASSPHSFNRRRSLHTDLWRVNGAMSRLRTNARLRESASSGGKSSRSSCTNT